MPYMPLSHPFVERLIGTLRREFLDHVLFWNARDLERKLLDFKDYYNRQCAHYALGGIPPSSTSGEMRSTTAGALIVEVCTNCPQRPKCQSATDRPWCTAPSNFLLSPMIRRRFEDIGHDMGHRYPKRTQLKYTKQRYRVRNWPEYEAGLRERGDLTLWFSQEAIAAWRAPTGEKPGCPLP